MPGRIGTTSLAVLAAAMLAPSAVAQTEGLTRPTVTIAVSPAGNDAADGSVAHPFRTLTRAQAAVRAANANSDVVVRIADGTYRLDAPITLAAADGGQKGWVVTWAAAPGAKPVLSGGVAVTGWKLHDKARHIYVADVPRGIASRHLFVDGRMAERAAVELDRSKVRFTDAGLEVDDPVAGDLSRLGRNGALELVGLGHFTTRFSPVERIEGRTLVMKQPAWANNIWGYDTLAHPYNPEEGKLYLRGDLAFLTRPNQWVLDAAAGKLYYRPADGADIAQLDVELPRLESLLHIAGTYDAPVRNVTVRGLRFSHTSWRGPNGPEGYASQQSGSYLTGRAAAYPADPLVTCKWGCPAFESVRNEWSQMPAAVQVAAAEGIRFDGNVFAHLGQYALGIGNDPSANASGVGLGAVDVVVSRNVFTDLAGGAIVAGGVRRDAHHPSDPRMTNRQLTIVNNLVRSVSKDYSDNSAILSTYVDGAQIVHNDISDTPYDAIDIGYGWGMHDAGGNPNYRTRMHGYDWPQNKVYETPTTHRNVVVAYNRIYDTKTHFEDGGAIYNLSASPGTVIAENHIFDLNRRIALYLDEGSKYITVRNNVVDDAGKWLNINAVTPAVKMWLRVSTDNLATGNWHNGGEVGGWWTPYLNNRIEEDHPVTGDAWPAEAIAVMANAGIEPGAGDISYRDVRARPNPHAKTKDDK
ncbi:right-handed parallel beta-helix repeat-containing protein [Sphingopyxis panaciterrulae]|uniref:DUF1565 domain-containing protein n=1 Tax=Sphingopyxis panaciterrulae TaxID=462372 RepID=A0A7W9B3U4_9SPHN|nr:right-handed parallel beta-helix repeat-containing protein [Sphingopyxis panaciterrulae]MBB5705743.1 hypothetical protein [Sphingopyxis panaciterrulae]